MILNKGTRKGNCRSWTGRSISTKDYSAWRWCRLGQGNVHNGVDASCICWREGRGRWRLGGWWGSRRHWSKPGWMTEDVARTFRRRDLEGTAQRTLYFLCSRSTIWVIINPPIIVKYQSQMKVDTNTDTQSARKLGRRRSKSWPLLPMLSPFLSWNEGRA